MDDSCGNGVLQLCHVTILPGNGGNVTVTPCGPTFERRTNCTVRSITLDSIKEQCLNSSHVQYSWRATENAHHLKTGPTCEYQQTFEVRHGRGRLGPAWKEVSDPPAGTYHTCPYSAAAMAEAAAAWWSQEYKDALGSSLFGRVVAERLRPGGEVEGSVRHEWRAVLPHELTRNGTVPYWSSVCLVAQHVLPDLPITAKNLRALRIRYHGDCTSSGCSVAVVHEQEYQPQKTSATICLNLAFGS